MSDPYADIAAPAGGDPYAAVAAPRRKRSLVDDLKGYGTHVLRGTGIGDELWAGAGTIADVVTGHSGPNVVQTYRDELAKQRGTEDSYEAAHPVLAANGRALGNALTIAAPIGPGAEAFAGGNMVTNALRGGAVAGLTGAGFAAADRGSLAERWHAAGEAAHDPATLALGAGFGSMAGMKPRATKPAVPTRDELAATRDESYAAMRAKGEQYSADQYRDFTSNLTTALRDAGFNPGNHPKAAAKLDQISNQAFQAADAPVTVESLDQLRQQVQRDVSSSPDEGDRRMGTIMKGVIDKFIADQGGSPELLAGRDAAKRVFKLDELGALDDKAARRAARTGSGGNKENALRQNVDRFLETSTNLTPDEAAQAEATVMGSRTGNALRQVGKLSPEGNGLGLAVHAVGGVTSHGATLPLAIGGFIAKRASEAITNRNVQALRDLIASGGEAAQEVSRQLASDPAAEDLRRQLANDLAAQAGVQGASRRGSVSVELPDHPELGVAFSRR